MRGISALLGSNAPPDPARARNCVRPSLRLWWLSSFVRSSQPVFPGGTYPTESWQHLGLCMPRSQREGHSANHGRFSTHHNLVAFVRHLTRVRSSGGPRIGFPKLTCGPFKENPPGFPNSGGFFILNLATRSAFNDLHPRPDAPRPARATPRPPGPRTQPQSCWS